MAATVAVAVVVSGAGWGKLPYTVYDANYTTQVSLFDYDMSKPPGRTYR